jgi:hypothetical protein
MSTISPAALILAVFPIAAWGFQISSFHPLAPVRPPARAMRPSNGPPTAQHLAMPANASKLTPEMRKRIADGMKSKAAASKKTPPTKKFGR